MTSFATTTSQYLTPEYLSTLPEQFGTPVWVYDSSVIIDDVQIHFLPILDSWDDVPGEPLPATHGFTLKVGYLQPKSRGELLLRS